MRRSLPLLVGTVLLLAACADKPYEPYQPVVAIDPGHGGVDPGAIGSSSGTLEKDVTLRTGLALRRQLEATGRYRVIMTREDDRFVRLPDRLEIASQSGSELLISLHADSLTTAPEINGASVYTLSRAMPGGDPAPPASNGNGAPILAGADSRQEEFAPEKPVGLAQRHNGDESLRLADLLVRELNGATTMVKLFPLQANFVVLTSRDVPSVLVELGYLSNPADEQALADDAHIARLAIAITRAVDAYFGTGPL